MNRDNRGPIPLWQLALYVAVLGVVSMMLAPLTGLWWIVPVLGAAVPVVLAVLQGREQQGAAIERAPEIIEVARPQLPAGPAQTRPVENVALENGVAAGAELSAGAARSALPESTLSERELEVLALLAAGRTNVEVATALFISVGTVKSHSANIYRKLEAKNRTEAVARARERGLLE